jgi:hypothetical protein
MEMIERRAPVRFAGADLKEGMALLEKLGG